MATISRLSDNEKCGLGAVSFEDRGIPDKAFIQRVIEQCSQAGDFQIRPLYRNELFSKVHGLNA